MRCPLLAILSFGAICSLTSAPQAGLVAYYPFSGNAYDASGNGHHATVVEGTLLTHEGHDGSAYEFDGVFGRIVVPVDIGPTAMPRMTMGCWANADVADQVIRGIMTNDNGVFDRGLDVDIRDNPGLRWSAFGGPTGGVIGGDLVVPGKWVFLAVSYDHAASEARLWVDDQLYTRTADPNDGEPELTIGRNPNFDHVFDGRIDDVFIYDEVLSDGAIDSIRDSGRAAILGATLKAETFTRQLLGEMHFNPTGHIDIADVIGLSGFPAFDSWGGERHLHQVVVRARTTYSLIVEWVSISTPPTLDCISAELYLKLGDATLLSRSAALGTCDGAGSNSLGWVINGDNVEATAQTSLIDFVDTDYVKLAGGWQFIALIEASGHPSFLGSLSHETVFEVEYQYTGPATPWTDLGGVFEDLADAFPCVLSDTLTVVGKGNLLPGETISILLYHHLWNSPSFLAVGTNVWGVRFKGGVLYPNVGSGLALPVSLVSSPLEIEFLWPSVPPGTELVLQAWVLDSPQCLAGSATWLGSNGLRGTSP